MAAREVVIHRQPWFRTEEPMDDGEEDWTSDDDDDWEGNGDICLVPRKRAREPVDEKVRPSPPGAKNAFSVMMNRSKAPKKVPISNRPPPRSWPNRFAKPPETKDNLDLKLPDVFCSPHVPDVTTLSTNVPLNCFITDVSSKDEYRSAMPKLDFDARAERACAENGIRPRQPWGQKVDPTRGKPRRQGERWKPPPRKVEQRFTGPYANIHMSCKMKLAQYRNEWHSVMVVMHGFKPYMYVAAPGSYLKYAAYRDWTDQDAVSDFKTQLREYLRQSIFDRARGYIDKNAAEKYGFPEVVPQHTYTEANREIAQHRGVGATRASAVSSWLAKNRGKRLFLKTPVRHDMVEDVDVVAYALENGRAVFASPVESRVARAIRERKVRIKEEHVQTERKKLKAKHARRLFIVDVELVERVSIMGHHFGQKSPHFKITFTTANVLKKCRDLIGKLGLPVWWNQNAPVPAGIEPFDSARTAYEHDTPKYLAFYFKEAKRQRDIASKRWSEFVMAERKVKAAARSESKSQAREQKAGIVDSTVVLEFFKIITHAVEAAHRAMERVLEPMGPDVDGKVAPQISSNCDEQRVLVTQNLAVTNARESLAFLKRISDVTRRREYSECKGLVAARREASYFLKQKRAHLVFKPAEEKKRKTHGMYKFMKLSTEELKEAKNASESKRVDPDIDLAAEAKSETERKRAAVRRWPMHSHGSRCQRVRDSASDLARLLSEVGASVLPYLDARAGRVPAPPFATILGRGAARCHEIDDVIDVDGMGVWRCFDCNIVYTQRFMIDNEASGCSWFTLNPGKYFFEKTRDFVKLHAHYRSVKFHRHDDPAWSHSPPLRVISFDIECAASGKHFPKAQTDPVIQVALTLSLTQESALCQKPEHLHKIAFALRDYDPIAGVHVVQYPERAEGRMLMDIAQFMRKCSPDILTGYNINGFDIPYMRDRAVELARREHVAHHRAMRRLQEEAARLGYAPPPATPWTSELDNFLYWSTIPEPLDIRNNTFNSKGTGTQKRVDITFPGCTVLDAIRIFRADHKLSSYTLNAVSEHFLKQKKVDVHHSLIPVLYNSKKSSDRTRLLRYCVKDTVLPILLLYSQMKIVNMIEMCRVTGVTMTVIMVRGQGVRQQTQIAKASMAYGLIMPWEPANQRDEDEIQYKGATVIAPERGFYQNCVFTLDFASLYPTIMMGHHLCYSTRIREKQRAMMSAHHLARDAEFTAHGAAGQGSYFVRPYAAIGCLPTILMDMWTSRKAVKKLMEQANENMKKARAAGDHVAAAKWYDLMKIYDGRQQALKVSMNSVYGFCAGFMLRDKNIAATVTSRGREYIFVTRRLMNEMFTRSNGYPYDCKVIYGDTDSVMVLYPEPDLKIVEQIARRAVNYLNPFYRSPMYMEFEKTYRPYLLMNKKRYVGFKYEPGYDPKMDAKGLENVRRDNTQFLRATLDPMYKLIMTKGVEAAAEYARAQARLLLSGRVSTALLITSKTLSANYKSVPEHLTLTRKMRMRDPGSAPHVGDRVPYVYLAGPEKTLARDLTEDPMYAVQNQLPLNFPFYFHRKFQKAIVRMFVPMYKGDLDLNEGRIEESLRNSGYAHLDHDNMEKLVNRIHKKRRVRAEARTFSRLFGNLVFSTRITKAVPLATKSGSIMKYVVRNGTCLGCKTELAPGHVVCPQCEPRKPEFFREETEYMRKLLADRLVAQKTCVDCVGDNFDPLDCANLDCSNIYERLTIVHRARAQSRRVQSLARHHGLPKARVPPMPAKLDLSW